MKSKSMKAGTAALAFTLCFGTLGYAADSSPESIAKDQTQMKGTIQGEVKTVQPDVVIVEVVADNTDKKEVRLPLNQSTHMGPIGQGDQVVAFVTPGGTTTSIQPLDSRWYR